MAMETWFGTGGRRVPVCRTLRDLSGFYPPRANFSGLPFITGQFTGHVAIQPRSKHTASLTSGRIGPGNGAAKKSVGRGDPVESRGVHARVELIHGRNH